MWWADQTYADLLRAVGLLPDGAEPPTVVVLRNIPQYNAFAAGDPASQRPATEGSGTSSVYYAYTADSWVDPSTGDFRGAGVCYWDAADPALAPFGQHAVRHAAAQAYLEAVDPSWDAVSALATSPPGTPVDQGSFWGEKRLPAWFRFGVAAYADRYFEDREAAEGTDPWWARTWAISNLEAQGGLSDLEEVLAFELDPNEPERSSRLVSEAGLVLSFILDGDCRPVQEQHAAVKLALREDGDVAAAFEALEKALLKNEKKLRRYARP